MLWIRHHDVNSYRGATYRFSIGTQGCEYWRATDGGSVRG
jgi:hypothetical protein